MNETNTSAAATLFMREETRPSLSPALEADLSAWIAAGPAGLRDFRSAALQALRRTGLPHAGSEEFSFVRVGEFLPHLNRRPQPETVSASGPAAAGAVTREEILPLIYPESRESYLVLVDGVYAPEISRPGAGFQVRELQQALDLAAPDAAGLRDSLLPFAQAEEDAAGALAMIHSRRPLWIKAAPRAILSSPLQILHYRSAAAGPEPHRLDSFLVFQAGKLSESRILVRHAGLRDPEADAVPAAPAAGARTAGSGTLVNAYGLLLLEEAASVHLCEAGPDAEQDIHFHRLAARLERNSRLFTVSASTGTRLMRSSASVDLLGEGCEAEINGAAVLTASRQCHQFLRVRHLVPHCASRQHIKTVVADQSKSSVDGTIFVAPDAQLTNASQLINNLMLSDQARADSKPRLMIHADDVKCSHGTTVGKLDAGQEFYLRTRGLTGVQARTLMTVAFIAEITGKSAEGGFKAHLEGTLLDTLKHRMPAEPLNGSGEGK